MLDPEAARTAPALELTSPRAWLPPDVVRCVPRLAQRLADVNPSSAPAVLRAFSAAPVGSILAIRTPGSAAQTLLVPGRHVQSVVFDPHATFQENVDRTQLDIDDLAGCLLDGVVERVDEPATALTWAYERLRPGGILVLTALDLRRASARRMSSATGGDRKYLFPGETLAALLFHEGFVAPRFHEDGRHIVAVARRGDEEPPWCRPQRLSVVMPVYNERTTFQKTMDRLLDKEIPGVDIDVTVVESNSTDGTRDDVLTYRDNPRVHIILEDAPLGKGHAVRRGLQAIAGDFVLIQDADLEYDIDDYEALLEPLRECQVGFVLGMRTSANGSWGMRKFGQNTFASHVMNVGHVVFLTLFNVVYRQKLRDPFTMYKVMRRDCLEGLTFECDRFDFDWELTAKLIRAGYHPLELPVSYCSRSFHEGKKVSFWRDPLTWIIACFRYRFARLYADE